MEKQELLKAYLKSKRAILEHDFIKNKKGFGYHYLSLDQINDIVEPILTENNLILFFNCQEEEYQATLIHESGEELSFTIGKMELDQKANMNQAQKKGANLTYARRYLIQNIFNIVADEDTDAVPSRNQNTSTIAKPQTSYTTPTKTEPKKYPKIEKEQVTITSTSITKRDFKDAKGVVKAIVNIQTREGEEEGLFVNAFDKSNAPKTDQQLIGSAISQLIQTKQNRLFTVGKEVIHQLNLTKEQKDYFLSKKGTNEIVFEDSFAGVPF